MSPDGPGRPGGRSARRASDPAGPEGARRSAAQKVADALRERILRGELRPGAPLREVAIAESVGASRGTVREALRALEHEGIVSSSLHRGATVAELSVSDVEDIFRLRRTMELAAIQGAGAAPPEATAQLAVALEELFEAAGSGDAAAMVDADLWFHRRVVGLVGSRRLDDLYRAIQGEFHLCLSILSVVDEEIASAEAILREHRAVYAAISEGRFPRAEELMAAHLDASRDRLVEVVAARSEPRPEPPGPGPS